MQQIFQRFGPRTEKILIQAQELARQLNRELKTDCLILAILDSNSLGGELLKRLGATKEIILPLFDLEKTSPAKKIVPLHPEIKNVISQAAYLAFKHHSAFIEPEFILLALIRDGDYVGNRLLDKAKINLEKLDRQIQEWLSNIKEITEKNNLMSDFIAESIGEEIEEEEVEPALNNNLKLSAINFFSRDLTNLAEKNRLDKISCRDREIESLVRILLRRNKNNPLIIGEPGVGKTALVEGLAQNIVNKKVPLPLINKKIFSLDLTKLVAGTTYRGQFEERITAVIEEAKSSGDVILFIDEMHTALGAGAAEGALDVAQILKPYLAAGDFAVIGATTFDEYRKYLEKDRALARRFSVIKLTETSFEDTILILKQVKNNFEKHFDIHIPDKLLANIVELAARYLPEKFFPDKALDLLDEGAASLIPNFTENLEIEDLKKKLIQTNQDKLKAISSSDYNLAHELRKKEDVLHLKLMKAEKNNQKPKKIFLTIKDIAGVLSRKIDLPIKITDEKIIKINLPKDMDNILMKAIFGQEKALRQINSKLKEGIYKKKRSGPLTSFVFIGPTGVGKTATAKIIAQEIFGSKESLLKFDMSEFSERHSVSSLIGAPAGFVGFEEGGKLTNAVRFKPFSVVLFDEIEKAHPDVFNLLLQILEDGYLSDNFGRKIDFSHTVIILTSNLGNKNLPGLTKPIGFRKKENNHLSTSDGQILKNFYREELNDFLSPELLGRLSEIIVFNPLNTAAQKQILISETRKLKKDFHLEGISLVFTKDVENYLIKHYDSSEGARSLKKIVNDFILKPLIVFLEKNPVRKAQITQKNGKITITALA